MVTGTSLCRDCGLAVTGASLLGPGCVLGVLKTPGDILKTLMADETQIESKKIRIEIRNSDLEWNGALPF